MRSLYICYFGLQEPLVQTQVLPYLRELVKAGISVRLLTFEPRWRRWDRDSVDEWRTRLRADGIEWFRSAYHQRPRLLAKLFDIAVGTVRSVAIARRYGVDVLHGRSDVGTAIGSLARRVTGAKLIFDVRGLTADESAESGNWKPGGFLYRITKRGERYLHRVADAFVVLTERARGELFAAEDRPLEVIPCCVDRSRFAPLEPSRREAVRHSLGARDRIIIVYTGSLGGAYPARQIAAFFASAKACDPRVFPLVLTQGPRQEMSAELTAAGFAPDDYHLASAAPEAVPHYIAASDIGLLMIRRGYSKLAMSPTKFAEYLACGVPVISSRGIGDVDAQIEREKIGVLLDGFDTASHRRAFQRMEVLRRDPAVQRRCLALALHEYDLHSLGAVRYERLYRRLTADAEPLANAI